MLEALLIGLLAASSLVVGAAMGLGPKIPKKAVGLLLGFGAGALISGVSFELAREAIDVGGVDALAVGLAIGAATFYLGDRRLEGGGGLRLHRPRRHGQAPKKHAGAKAGGAAASGGTVLALGALLDGVPEQAALGISIAGGQGASIALIAAIFLSNLPEGLGSAAQLRQDGRSTKSILVLWGGVALAGALSTVLGDLLLDGASGNVTGAVSGFAAGAILVMLVDSMIPEAYDQGGRAAGLATIVGYAVAVALSTAG